MAATLPAEMLGGPVTGVGLAEAGAALAKVGDSPTGRLRSTSRVIRGRVDSRRDMVSSLFQCRPQGLVRQHGVATLSNHSMTSAPLSWLRAPKTPAGGTLPHVALVRLALVRLKGPAPPEARR